MLHQVDPGSHFPEFAMIPARFVKALAAVALFNGMLFVCVRQDLIAADKEEEARKYTEDLKKGKTAKVKITALEELGKLAAVQKDFATDALPYIYKALEDKDAGIRAAAAFCLGQCDEPADKALPALMKILKNDEEDEKVRAGAARGLACMGKAAKEALPTLNSIVKNSDKKSALAKAAKEAAKAIKEPKK
jgi:HEAT repeat protein